MVILSSLIPVPRNGKAGWYKSFQEHNYLLQQSPAKILLIGDSLISNLTRYPDIWKSYFSRHNALNFGIPGDKVQNILWRINNLNFSKITSLKYVFILGGTNNIDHNSPEEIVSSLISSGLSIQNHCPNTKVVIIPLLPRDHKNSIRRGNINIINTLLLSECSKHNLHSFNYQHEWLNIDNSLNMSLFYKDELHLIKDGNELLAKEILRFYQQLQSKVSINPIRSFKDVTLFSLKESDFPPLQSSSNNHVLRTKMKKQQKLITSHINNPVLSTCFKSNTYVSTSRAYMQPNSTDDIIMSDTKSFKNLVQSSTVPVPVPVQAVFPISKSVYNNVINKPAIRNVVKPKCRRKSNVVRKKNVTTCDSNRINNAAQCNFSHSVNSRPSVYQPVHVNTGSTSKNVCSGEKKACKPVPSLNTKGEDYHHYKRSKNVGNIYVNSSVLFSLFLSLLVLNIYFLNNISCIYLRSNIIANVLTGCLLFLKHNIYNFSDGLGKTFFRIFFIYSNLYKYCLIIIHFCLVCKLFSSLFSLKMSVLVCTFSSSFCILLIGHIIFGLLIKSGKKKTLCLGFYSTFSKPIDSYYHFKCSFYSKICSLCHDVLSLCFYTLENLLDIIIFLDFLLSMIGGLFKKLFLSFIPFLIYLYLFFVITVFVNNSFYNNNFNTSYTFLTNRLGKTNISETVLFQSNNVSLFGQRDITLTSVTPINAITSCKPLMFFFIVSIFFKHFL